MYQISEPDDAVFFVGRSIRKTSNKELDSFMTGTWSFKDSVVAKAAAAEPIVHSFIRAGWLAKKTATYKSLLICTKPRR